MILSMKPLSLAEAKELVPETEEKKPLQDYLKRFTKLSAAQAKELREKLTALNNIKFKEEHLAKVADFLPRDSEEVQKIFNDVSLDESDINAVLSVVKEY